MDAIIHATFSSFKTQQMSTEKKKQKEQVGVLWYDEKVKSLKENFLWQVHNLKLEETFGASVVVLCRGLFFFFLFFLEAEVRGSVSYTVNGFQSRRTAGGPSVFISKPPVRFFSWSNFRWKSSLIVIIPFPGYCFRWVGGCDVVFVMVQVSQVHNHCGVASPLTSTPCCCSCARSSALSFFSSSIWKIKDS